MAASDGHQDVVNRYNTELLRTIRERRLAGEGAPLRRVAGASDAVAPPHDPTAVVTAEGLDVPSHHGTHVRVSHEGAYDGTKKED